MKDSLLNPDMGDIKPKSGSRDMPRGKILNGSKATGTMNRILDVNQAERSFRELKGSMKAKKNKKKK